MAHMPLRLLTFGGLGLVYDDGSSAPRVKPARLALLAALAAAGERGVSRERLMACFWSDSDETHGRHSLRQALYLLRQDLGRDVVRSHEIALSLDGSLIATDLAEFRAALAGGDCARAVGLARGPFLDGFYLPGAPAFERWVEEERSRLGAAVTGALLSLAGHAESNGDRDAEVEWWRQLTLVDPLSGRFAAGYLTALAALGDRARALAFARDHEALVRRELDTEPDPEVRRVAARLRTMPVVDVGGSAPDDGQVASPLRPGPDRGHLFPATQVRHGDAVPDAPRAASRIRLPRVAWAAGGVALLALITTAALARQQRWFGGTEPFGAFAVGQIRDDGLPDSLHIGPVLTDMLATNLARVGGLSVLANSRLLELMSPGQDSSAAGYIDAARRAGARQLVEGRVYVVPNAGLTLELRHVELRSGLVSRAYRVIARDRYALIDSVTHAIANALELATPRNSVAASTTGSPVAYRLYEEGLRAFYQADLNAARRLMRAALEEDSLFAMAAYYEAVLAHRDEKTPDGRHVTEARRRARRLALRVPERERLLITAHLLEQDQEPDAVAVAESLAMRFPADPQALTVVGSVRIAAGDWAGAVAAMQRAIAIDSLTETGGTNCRLCQNYSRLAEAYFWWDSLPAVERTARQLQRVRPDAQNALYLLALAGARRGDSTSAYAAFRRLLALNATDRAAKLNLDLSLEEYDIVERDVRQLLASSSAHDWGSGAWVYLIALRNQGRLRAATQFHLTGVLPGLPVPTAQRSPDLFNQAILALERGEAKTAAAAFGRLATVAPHQSRSGQARNRAWSRTLQGMALAAAGDTSGVRQLADTVERWGRGSLYGRDRKAHHFLRGLVLAAEGRHAEAVRRYEAAIHSPSLGFTRVNYELARSLMQLARPGEAVAALQPALRGEIDAANLYITRTEIHELLAQAFDAVGVRDSAAVHYRAVVKAWARADPAFHARRAAARSWLERHAAEPPLMAAATAR